MNGGSSFGLCRYRLLLLAIVGSVVAVTSISEEAVVHGDATVSTHKGDECDSSHVPASFIESKAAKAMVMLQHDTARSFGYQQTNGIDPPNHVEAPGIAPTLASGTEQEDKSRSEPLVHATISEIAPNASQDHIVPSSGTSPKVVTSGTSSNTSVATGGGTSVEKADTLKKPAPEPHSASAPGSNATSRKLALEASVGAAMEGEGGVHADARKKRKHKKREVESYWDKLPIFFAGLAIPLLCLVTRSSTGAENSKRDNDVDTEDYWDAQRSVGLHSR